MMKTATQLHELRQKREAAFFIAIVCLGTLVLCLWLTHYIPVTTPEHLPHPGWSDESEPEEDPCVSPAQQHYFDRIRKERGEP